MIPTNAKAETHIRSTNMDYADIFNAVKAIAPSDCKVSFDNGELKAVGNDYMFAIWIRPCDEDAHFVRNLPMLKSSAEKGGMEWTYKIMERIHATWRMGTALYGYSYPLSKSGEAVVEAEAKNHHNYLAAYRIPNSVKAAVLDAVRSSIDYVEANVATDPDGCNYNSIHYKPI